MLKNVPYRERGWLKTLKIAHEAVLRRAVTHSLDPVMKREDPPFDATVSKNGIQEHPDALQKQLKG